MTKCEHNTSTVQADHGNVTLSECDWGCGAILISITGEDGIARTMTADEALAFSKMETTDDLSPEQMTAAEREQAAIDWIQDNAPDHVLQYLDQDANASHLYIVSLEMGMDDLLQQNAARKAELIKLQTERKQIAAVLGIKAEHYDLLDFVQATVNDLDERNEALEIVIAENDALRTAYEVACEIFRSQAIILPRLQDKWRTAVQRVEAVGE